MCAERDRKVGPRGAYHHRRLVGRSLVRPDGMRLAELAGTVQRDLSQLRRAREMGFNFLNPFQNTSLKLTTYVGKDNTHAFT